MNSKFKVGDKVFVTKSKTWRSLFIEGMTGVVTRITKFECLVQFDQPRAFAQPSDHFVDPEELSHLTKLHKVLR